MFWCAAALAALCSVSPALALEDQLSVVTSYPEELTTRFEAAFEKAYPSVRLKIVWKQGRDAYAILTRPGHDGMDVYWSPALDTFPRLKDAGVFQPLAHDRSQLPGKIGAQAISDPDGMYEAFEVAGYAIAVNPDELAKHKLAAPAAWSDLAQPPYAGLVSMPVAGKVGFSPPLYDTILQSEGWEKGWALLSEMSGNADFATAGTVPTASLQEGKAAALTMDFFPLSAAASGLPVSVIYPKGTSFVPAQVALVQGAPHPDAAKAFIDFVLSQDGQKLLLHPDIRRHPVRPDAYEGAPAGTVDPFASAANLFPYDALLGMHRRNLIAALFDAALTERHGDLVTAWKAVHDAEQASPDDAKKAMLAKVRRLLGAVPVTAAQATDQAFLAGLADEDARKAQAAQWRAALADNLKQAQSLMGLPATAP